MAVRRAPSLSVASSLLRLRPSIRLQPLAVESGTRLTRFVARVRGRHLALLDIIGVLVGGVAVLAVRSDGVVSAAPWTAAVAPAFLSLVVARSVVNIGFGLYSRHWRFASVPELERIIIATFVGSLAAASLFYTASAVSGLAWADSFPRSFWIAEFLTSAAIVGASRFGIRIAFDRAARPHAHRGSKKGATLLYGAGQSGVLVARSAQRGLASVVRPVGFLDDDPSLAGRHVAGLRVFGGLSSISAAVEATGADTVLITMPSAPGSAVRAVVDAALALGLEVRTVPSIDDMLDGSIAADRIRHVRVEDLLRRPVASDHAAMVREIIAGQTVVITGAAGSIGSELARQAFGIGPKRLVLVDRSESALFDIQRELAARQSRGQAGGDVVIHLANVASRAAMSRLINLEKPDVIFHAAAYKHVPMMETHPSDAAYVNVGGTMALLDAAIAADVKRFVFVSTDKAVNPSSVMGASKRMGEMLVAEAAQRTGHAYVSVRFGNVLGSNGSVVPIFREQLEKGEPLTITHPDMTRFFMTIPEAAWLILDAAALGGTSDLFVLDMGEPVRVVDLARDLVRLAGRDPDSQPFQIIGLRPGEKLHEELFYANEDVRPTSSSKVLRVTAPPPPADIRDKARQLLEIATGDNEPAVAALLRSFVAPPSVPPAATVKTAPRLAATLHGPRDVSAAASAMAAHA